jgi:GWxTD domain-containing protein
VLVAICSAQVAAELPSQLAAWPDGPVGILLSEAERQDYETIENPRAAQRFIDVFWARRDPDLETRDNEFRADFEARVRAANQQFTTDQVEGWRTDRGRTLILLGLPGERKTGRIVDYFDSRYGDSRRGDGNLRNQKIGEITDLSDYLKHETGGRSRRGDFDDVASDASFRESEAPSGLTTRHGVEFNLASGVVDVWVYGQGQLPAPVRDEFAGVDIPFFDTQGEGDYRLVKGDIEAPSWAAVLDAAPATFIAHPELVDPPVYPLIPGYPAATAAELRWLEPAAAEWPDGAQAVAVRGVRSASDTPVWVFVQLPPDLPRVDRVIGRLTSPEGWPQGTFAAVLTGDDAVLGRYYEFTVPEWTAGDTLEVALADGNDVVARCALEVDAGAGEPGQPFLTAFHAGAEIQERPTFDPGEPFVYGGYHLVVRPGGFYAPDENLNYFMLAAMPDLAGDESPILTLSMRVLRGTTTLFVTPHKPVELSPVAPGVFMYGSQLPIAALPEPGTYRLRLTMSDEAAGVSRSTDIRFNVVDSLAESPALSRPGLRQARSLRPDAILEARAVPRGR